MDQNNSPIDENSPGESRKSPAESPATDRGTRQAALIATLIALPVTVAVAVFAFVQLRPDTPEPAPAPTTAAPQAASTVPVEIAAPELTERQAVVCRALLSQLPPQIQDLPQRPVSAGAEQNAAYGDPALTVACGVTPVDVPPLDDVYLVNRVCWYGSTDADGTRLTTLDREVPVQVWVPATYGSALQRVSGISETIIETVPSGGNPPQGCTG